MLAIEEQLPRALLRPHFLGARSDREGMWRYGASEAGGFPLDDRHDRNDHRQACGEVAPGTANPFFSLCFRHCVRAIGKWLRMRGGQVVRGNKRLRSGGDGASASHPSIYRTVLSALMGDWDLAWWSPAQDARELFLRLRCRLLLLVLLLLHVVGIAVVATDESGGSAVVVRHSLLLHSVVR